MTVSKDLCILGCRHSETFVARLGDNGEVKGKRCGVKESGSQELGKEVNKK